MTICARCGIHFNDRDDQPLCGICRIELRSPDGGREHAIAFGNAYAATHGFKPLIERPR